MKKILCVVLALFASLTLLAACGAAPKASQPEPETAVIAMEEMSTEDVMDYIDKPVSALIAAFGEPESSSYSTSCLGDGKDGMLRYAGLDVYTYQDASGEVIMDIELTD